MTIYIVLRNADMTEGRGPMVLDNVFIDREKALHYASTQPGVMGRKQFDYKNLHHSYTTQDGWKDGKPIYRTIGKIIFNCDYEVIEYEVEG